MLSSQGDVYNPKPRTSRLPITMPTVIGESKEAVTWQCDECEEEFNDDYLYREHMAARHWACLPCSWQFLDEKTFQVSVSHRRVNWQMEQDPQRMKQASLRKRVQLRRRRTQCWISLVILGSLVLNSVLESSFSLQNHVNNCEDFQNTAKDSEMFFPEIDLIQYKNDRLFYQFVKMRIRKQTAASRSRQSRLRSVVFTLATVTTTRNVSVVCKQTALCLQTLSANCCQQTLCKSTVLSFSGHLNVRIRTAQMWRTTSCHCGICASTFSTNTSRTTSVSGAQNATLHLRIGVRGGNIQTNVRHPRTSLLFPNY